MMELRALLETVARLAAILHEGALSNEDRLEALETAWFAFAANARRDSLSIPGGFPAEKNRQVERLGAMAAIVREDTAISTG